MIILTGVSGFIGGRLLRKLQEAYGFDAVIAWTSENIAGARCVLHEGYKAETLKTSGALSDKITTVVHAGAAVHDVADESAAARNIEVTKLLLNALPHLTRFIYLSTVDVYNKAGVITESTQVAPANAYSKSKLACEKHVVDWAESRNAIGQVLRIGHVYGPGEERHKKVIPLMFRDILRGAPPKVFGEGLERRAFIYVDDVAQAIVSALELPREIGPINIASRTSVSMIDLAQLLLEITGSKKKIARIPVDAPGVDVVFDAAKCTRYLLDSETPLQLGLAREWAYMKDLYVEAAH